MTITRVVKVGGSLFNWCGLKDALRDWLAEQPPAVNVLIVGGGELANAIRDADRVHQLGDDAAHRLAIRTMSISAHLLAELLGHEAVIDDLRELRQETNEGCNDTPLLFDVQPWMLNRDERSAVAPLPHTWDVTSDSIAAALAIELEADELVLLKSTPTPSTDVDELSALGYVDRYFLKLAERVRKVRFVGLKC